MLLKVIVMSFNVFVFVFLFIEEHAVWGTFSVYVCGGVRQSLLEAWERN